MIKELFMFLIRTALCGAVVGVAVLISAVAGFMGRVTADPQVFFAAIMLLIIIPIVVLFSVSEDTDKEDKTNGNF